MVPCVDPHSKGAWEFGPLEPKVPGTDVGSCSGTWYLDLGFQKSVALLQACPAEPENTGAWCEVLALEGVLCVRGWAVGKEVGDQDLKFSGCSLLPGCMWGVRGRGQIREGPDSHRVPIFLSGVEPYHTALAAEQVELGFLIKLVFSISWILISQCDFLSLKNMLIFMSLRVLLAYMYVPCVCAWCRWKPNEYVRVPWN